MLREKLDEALSAVLPIITIVLALSLTVAPMTSGVTTGPMTAAGLPDDYEIILL